MHRPTLFLSRAVNLIYSRSRFSAQDLRSAFNTRNSLFSSFVLSSHLDIMSKGETSSELKRIKEHAELTDKILADLQAKVAAVKQAAVKEAGLGEEEKLRQENVQLKLEIDKVKKALTLAEIGNGVRQVFMPTKAELAKFSVKTVETDVSATETPATQVNGLASQPAKTEGNDEKTKPAKKPEAGGKKAKAEKTEVGGKKAKTEKAESAGNKAKTDKGEKGDAGEAKSKKSSGTAGGDGADGPVDISRLDMRVGKIVEVDKHPDADSLYVEKVDLGEGRNRTIVSGLVKHVPITAMKDRIAVFMCNLKPAKMRGVLSEGMIMCASSPEKVEILVPPADAAIGDIVSTEQFPGKPDAQLNPKKKIWEALKPDTRTDADRVATYKGAPLRIEGKGVVVAPTLANTQIS